MLMATNYDSSVAGGDGATNDRSFLNRTTRNVASPRTLDFSYFTLNT